LKRAAFDPVHKPGHVKCRDIGTPGSRDDYFRFKVQGSRAQGSRVQRFRVQKKAARPGSYQTGKLEGLKARMLAGFLASQPSSDERFD
jgi:hypothetical protein